MWYESLPQYMNATPAEQAKFRALTTEQQMGLLNANPYTAPANDDIYMGGGYGYIDPIMQYLGQYLNQQGMGYQTAGYVPGSIYGLEGLIPSLGRDQFRSGLIMQLADLESNPRDWGQLQKIFALTGTESPITAAATSGMSAVGDDWQSLIDNLAGMIPGMGETTTPTQTPTQTPAPTPPAIPQSFYDLYEDRSASDLADLNRFFSMTPEQQKYVGSMSGGGKMTINEPAVIIGMKSGNPYATIAETAPEMITITSQKQTAKGEGETMAQHSYDGQPESFAGGGGANVGWQDRNAKWNEQFKGRVMGPEDTARMTRDVFPGGLNIPQGLSGLKNRITTQWKGPALPANTRTQGPQGGTPPTSTPETAAGPAWNTNAALSPDTVAQLMAMLNLGFVPRPSDITQGLFNQLPPSVLAYLMGSSGVSGMGFDPQDWIAEKMKFDPQGISQSVGYRY